MSPYPQFRPHLAIFGLFAGLVSSVLVSACAWYYLRRVRLERPAIGTFNGRDIVILFVLLVHAAGVLPACCHTGC